MALDIVFELITDRGVTSMERALGHPVDLDAVKESARSGAKPQEPLEPTIAIPPPAGGDPLPFKISAIVTLEEPEPRRQVVLRDTESGDGKQ